ncbi:MAG: hypothetical protein AAGD10_18025 [Myxococcota bacterium]
MRDITLDSVAADAQKRFGTFLGVFTPSILTILGVIMYQRLGWVVGQAGYLGALGVVVLAHVISVTTGLSVASIATNHTVRTGGNYYIISRSLGLSVGGAIGLALYAALALGVSLYLIGFAEAFIAATGWSPTQDPANDIRLIGSAACLFLAIITLWSTEIAIKSQLFVLAAIVLSLFAIVFGRGIPAETAAAAPQVASVPFAAVFAVFFPAVTGFTAGVGMSGDLRDPKRSIPLGTMAAIGVGLLIYVGLVWLLSTRVPPEVLRSDYNVLRRMSVDPRFVTVGVFAATLSSALGSMLGAPRTLQALALDGIVPEFLGRGKDEPRIALLVTLLIAEGGILLAQLDVVGAIISMFFLTCYGFLCLACGLERWASPDFRPQFRVPIWVSLGGALACFLVMFQIDALAMFAAIAVMTVMYAGLKRRQLVLGTGDTWGGVWSAVIRAGLMRLQSSASKSAQRNWRPNMLVVGRSRAQNPLLDFGQDLVGDRGLLTHVHLVEGEPPRPRNDAVLEKAYPGIFARIQGCEDVYDAIPQMAAHFGLAGMETNTILLGWPREAAQRRRYGEMIDRLLELDLSVLMLRHDETRGFGRRERIDVWWDGEASTGPLMLTLAHMVTSAPGWKHAKVRVLVNGRPGQDDERARRALNGIIQDARVRAEGVILAPVFDDEALASRIRTESARSDLLIIHALEAGPDSGFVPTNDGFMRSLGTTLLVRPSTFFAQKARVFDPGTIDLGRVDEKLSVPTPVPALVEPLQRLEQDLSELTERFHLAADQPSADEEAAFLAEVVGAVDEIRQLERRIERRGNRRAAARALVEWARSRFTAAVADRARVPFGTRGAPSHRDTGVWEKRLQQASQRLQEDLASCVARLPEQVEVATDHSDWFRRADDGPATRTFKSWVRFSHRWLARPFPPKQIKLREPATLVLRPFIDRELAELIEKTGERRRQALLRVRRIIEQVQRFFDLLLAELDQEREEEIDVEAFSRVLGQQLQGLEDVVTTQESKWSERRDEPRLHLKERLQNAAGRLGAFFDGESLHRKREAPKLPEFARASERTRTILDAIRLDLQLEASASEARRALATLAERIRREVQQGPLESIERARAVMHRVVELREEYESREPGEDEGWRSAFLSSADELRAAYDSIYKPDVQDMTDGLVGQLGRGVDRIPAQVSVPEAGEENQGGERSVAARRLAQSFFEVRIAAPARKSLDGLQAVVRRSEQTLVDAVRLVAFELEQAAAVDEERGEAEVEEAGTLALGGTLEDRIRRLEDASSELSKFVDDEESFLLEESARALDELHANVFGRATSATRAAGLPILDTLRRYSDRVRSAGRDAAERALRLTAEARAVRDEASTLVDELLRLRDELLPNPEVQAQLPLIYRRMFGRAALETPDLVVGRTTELARLSELAERWGRGRGGPVGLIGELRTGRTTLINTWLRGQDRPVIRVTAPQVGAHELEGLNQAVSKATGGREGQSAEGALRNLAPGAVVVVDELGAWLERSPEGWASTRAWFRLFRRLGERHLFVLTGNPMAFRLAELGLGVSRLFLGTERTGPLDRKALEAMLLLRQRTSDFDVEFASRRRFGGERPSAHFDRLHARSRGNPGEAVDLWRRSVVAVTEQKVRIDVRQDPDFTVLSRLPAQWSAALATLSLHRSVSAARLGRTLRISREEAQSLLGDLSRAGLARSEKGLSWDMDPLFQGPITRALQTKGYLP